MNLLPNFMRGWGGAWLVLCILLGGVVAVQAVDLWTNDDVQQLVNRKLTPTAEPALALARADEFQLPVVSHYKEVLERPLFIAGRRPPEETEEEQEEAVSQIVKTVRLTSIIIMPTRRFALLQEKKGKREVRRIEQGQRFSGWNVAEILPDRVLFRQGDKEEALKLREYKKFTVAPAKPVRKKPLKRRPLTARAKGPRSVKKKGQ